MIECFKPLILPLLWTSRSESNFISKCPSRITWTHITDVSRILEITEPEISTNSSRSYMSFKSNVTEPQFFNFGSSSFPATSWCQYGIAMGTNFLSCSRSITRMDLSYLVLYFSDKHGFPPSLRRQSHFDSYWTWFSNSGSSTFLASGFLYKTHSIGTCDKRRNVGISYWLSTKFYHVATPMEQTTEKQYQMWRVQNCA